MTYTDGCARTSRRARFLAAMVPVLVLAGCGSLDHYQLAPGQFNVWGEGAYADDADVGREASRACPTGYTKLSVYDGPGNADMGRAMRWRIACKGNPK